MKIRKYKRPKFFSTLASSTKEGHMSVRKLWPFILSSFHGLRCHNYALNLFCLYIYIYNSKSLDVVQSLYFGSKLPSSGTYKFVFCTVSRMIHAF